MLIYYNQSVAGLSTASDHACIAMQLRSAPRLSFTGRARQDVPAPTGAPSSGETASLSISCHPDPFETQKRKAMSYC